MKTLMKIKNVLQLGKFKYLFSCNTLLIISAAFDAVGYIVLQRTCTVLFLSQAYCPLSPSFLFQSPVLMCSKSHSLASSLFVLLWGISSSPITLNPKYRLTVNNTQVYMSSHRLFPRLQICLSKGLYNISSWLIEISNLLCSKQKS